MIVSVVAVSFVQKQVKNIPHFDHKTQVLFPAFSAIFSRTSAFRLKALKKQGLSRSDDWQLRTESADPMVLKSKETYGEMLPMLPPHLT